MEEENRSSSDDVGGVGEGIKNRQVMQQGQRWPNSLFQKMLDSTVSIMRHDAHILQTAGSL